MNPPSEDMRDILLESDAGLDLVYATNLFVNLEPDRGGVLDKVVTIYDTGGAEPDTERTLEYPTVMIRGRGDIGNYGGIYTLLESIKNELHGTANKTINGARYIGIWLTSDIFFIGYDEKKRPIVTINLRIQRTTA